MGKLPRWAKGKKIRCAILGDELPERDSRVRTQRGLLIHKDAYDKVTDEERAQQIKAALSRRG